MKVVVRLGERNTMFFCGFRNHSHAAQEFRRVAVNMLNAGGFTPPYLVRGSL